MPLELQFPLSSLIRRRSNSNNYLNVKPWVRKAIAEQEPKPNDQLWRDEPSAEFQYNDRLRRIRFLRKHANNDSLIQRMADRLELCERNNRCCSGACPECGRLLQRWFARKSKRLIRDIIDKADRQLVAITIIPAKPIIRPSNLHTLDAHNLKRRLIYALDKAEIDIAIGAIDFSFNEDKKGKYNPFWSRPFLFNYIYCRRNAGQENTQKTIFAISPTNSKTDKHFAI